jgi:hypothetical protein
LNFVQDINLGQIFHPGCVASGDLNGDGCAGVFYTESRCGPGYAMGPRFSIMPNYFGYSCSAVDFDGDGDQDVACIAGTSIHFYANETVAHSMESIAESPWPPASGVPTMTWVDSQSRSSAPDGSVNHPYRTITDAVNSSGPNASLAMTRIPLPAGTRIYVQGVILDPATLRYALTDAAVFTAE